VIATPIIGVYRVLEKDVGICPIFFAQQDFVGIISGSISNIYIAAIIIVMVCIDVASIFMPYFLVLPEAVGQINIPAETPLKFEKTPDQ